MKKRIVPLIIVSCKNCGKVELVSPCRERRYSTCSHKCSGILMKEHMEQNNPMYDHEIASKVKEKNLKNGVYERTGERAKVMIKTMNPILVFKGNNPIEFRKMYKNISQRMKIDNPMFNQEIVKKVVDTNTKNGLYERIGINGWFKNPENLRKALSASGKVTGNHISKGHLKVREHLISLGLKFEEEFYIQLNGRRRFIDFVIQENKKAIEYNGYWTHYTLEGIDDDNEKRRCLEEKGWEVLFIERNEVFERENMIKKLEEFCEVHKNR